jgi:hypothetical protein
MTHVGGQRLGGVFAQLEHTGMSARQMGFLENDLEADVRAPSWYLNMAVYRSIRCTINAVSTFVGYYVLPIAGGVLRCLRHLDPGPRHSRRLRSFPPGAT